MGGISLEAMGEHVHDVAPRASARYRRRLGGAFGLVVVFMLVEVVAGILSDSLALLSDAGHMATDALGLGMALAASSVADRSSRNTTRTYGLYRLEILAALANAVLLFGVAVYVIYEGIRRFGADPEPASGVMLVVATLGLGVNLVAWWLLRPGAGASLNMEGAMLEVLADLWGSVGVIVAAAVVALTGWVYADILMGMAIGVVILPRAVRLGIRAGRILVQAAPAGFDVSGLRRQLMDLEGVVDVHDLHVWTLTSEMDVASVHLMIPDDTDPHPVLDRARQLLREEHGVSHATLQVEPASHRGCSEITW